VIKISQSEILQKLIRSLAQILRVGTPFRLRKMLWIGGHLFGFLFQILNQAFITWLAMRDALTTGRNLFICGFQGDVKCIFCRHVIEDRDHLFFACGYSSKIWQQVMSLCSMLNRPTCREDVAFFGFEE
jgi:hypothetical protein